MVKKIQLETTGQKITNFSGIYPVLNFIEKLRIKKLLDKYLSPKQYFNQKYSFGQIITVIMCGLLAGQKRMKGIELFTRDPIIRKALEIENEIPDSTIKSRLDGIGVKECYALNELIGEASRRVHKKHRVKTEIIDCDSTVKTLYGNQEGARVGYNPHKKGARSYHPLLAFLNSTRECLLSYCRPGDSFTANNAAGFISHCAGNLYQGWKRLIFRMDCGFFSGEIFEAIEKISKAEYIIKVKMLNLTKFLECREWKTVPGRNGWEQTEFWYKAHGWDSKRRFIAVRRLVRIETEGLIFKRMVYNYFCYCTNMTIGAYQGYKFYGKRGTCENWIEAVKNQMFAGMIVTQNFWTNDFLWNLSVLAYNVSVWMRYLTSTRTHREEPDTFRYWFIKVAGKVIERGHKLILQVSECLAELPRWIRLYNAIDRLVL